MHGYPTDRVPRWSLAAAVAAGALSLAAPATATMTQVGLWHMDEGPGAAQALDSSGFNNHGQVSKVDTGLTGPDAFMGAAYRYKGKGSIVEVPSSSSLNPGSAAFSAQVHAKFTTKDPPTGSFDLIRKGFASTSGGDFKMEVRKGGKIRCHYVTSKGSGDVKSSGSLADGRWHRIACIKTAGELQLVVDDKTYKKKSSIGAISNNAKITIGAKTSSDDAFDGALDEVSFSIDR